MRPLLPQTARFLGCALALTVAVSAQPAWADHDDCSMPGTAVVKRTAGVPWWQVKAELMTHCNDMESQANFYGDQTRLYRYTLRTGSTDADVQSLLTAMVAAGTIRYGESDFTAHSANGQTGSLWVTDIGIGMGQFQNQYARQLLDLDQAHVASKGQGVVIAVIDSGVDLTHEAVQGPLAVWQWDFVDNDALPIDEGDGVDNDGDGIVDDGVGHGTYVTSLIRLVAPQAKFMHLRVLDDEGQSNAFMVALAIDSAVEHGADVVNVCAATEFNSAALGEAVVRARALGVTVVAPMGNDATLASIVTQYPAGFAECYAVCATDHVDVKADFSNWGAVADLSAPGSSLLGQNGPVGPSTSILGAVPGAGYAHWNGTSLSTAFSSGVVALVRAQFPHLPDETVAIDALAAFTMAKVSGGSESIDLLNPAYAGLLGSGRINAATAVAQGPIAPRVGDINADGLVDSNDLGWLLASWGQCVSDPCEADLDGDTLVNGNDLGTLFSAW